MHEKQILPAKNKRSANIMKEAFVNPDNRSFFFFFDTAKRLSQEKFINNNINNNKYKI